MPSASPAPPGLSRFVPYLDQQRDWKVCADAKAAFDQYWEKPGKHMRSPDYYMLDVAQTCAEDYKRKYGVEFDPGSEAGCHDSRIINSLIRG